MEEPLKILMTADTIGGVWTYTINLCKELEQYHVQIHVMTFGNNLSEEQWQQILPLRKTSIYESSYKLEWMEDAEKDVNHSRQWATRIYQHINPDIVHLNNFALAGCFSSTPMLLVYHSCVHTWWKAVKKESLPAAWNYYTSIVQHAIEESDIIIAPTESILHQVQDIFRQFPAQVIYNGINAASRISTPKQPFIFSAGRLWDEAKNMQLLYRLAPKIEWPVYIAGDFHENSLIEGDGIHFTGHLNQQQLFHYLSRASIFCMPSKYEPFGLSVLEAAHAECVLVLSNISSFREIWEDAAIYFDPWNESDAHYVLTNVIRDKGLQSELSCKAKERAAKFSAKKMAIKYFTLYQNLLNEAKTIS